MNMNDYVDVAERIAQLKEAYPEASLQPYDPSKPYEIVQVEGKTYVVYTAACYRDPHDVRPGVAVAWEQIPGKGMTAGSELMICETSAWGRAIVAAMKTATKRVASKQEVMAAKARQSWAVTPTATLDSDLLSRPVEPQPEVKQMYGSPGSKSALMERILRHQFIEEKKEEVVANPAPMSLDQVVDALATDTPAVQHCQHGEMQLKTGISKGRGTPFYGYVCGRGCDAKWATMSKETGKWYYPGANNG
jgi:hypothetical protein